MIFFTVTKPVSVSRHRLSQALVPQPTADPGRERPYGYVTSMYDFAELRERLAKTGDGDALRAFDGEAVLASPQAPVELGVSNRDEVERKQAKRSGRDIPMPFRSLEEQLGQLGNATAPRTAIINGFGTGIGDYVVGLTAWRVIRERMLAAGCLEVRTEIWARTHAIPRARVACPSEPSVAGIRALPVTLDEFLALDGYWDFSGMLDRPAFKQMPTIDFFLATLGVDPASVPAEQKRNRVLVPEPIQAEIDTALAGLGERFILLHPASSTPLRDMPVPIMSRLLDELAQRTDLQIASLHPLPVAAERYADLSSLFRSHQHFCAVIRRAAGLLTIDTSTYHIADAFDVPSLVIFTTVPPERWTVYYPTVEGVMLEGVRESKYFGLHRSADPVVLQDIQSFWERLNLTQLVDRFLELVAQGSTH